MSAPDEPEIDPEATVTFGDTPHPRGPRVELSAAEAIEEDVLGSKRPQSFEERYPRAGLIGEGGMGRVHLAQDRVLKRDVAIKVLRREGRPDALVLRRFLREAQVTAQLAHPNVVPLYGLESTGQGAPAFVMKLIEGVTFKEYAEVCRRARGTERWDHDTHGLKTRIEHFVKACDAVAFSHERGVIHRDLKPANAMLGSHNVVYVMDWGIARIVGEPDEDETSGRERLSEADLPDTRTRTGDVMGTPMYMSPEQASAASSELTPASDQYSLGLMLFNLVSFKAPRDAESATDAIEMAREGRRAAFPGGGPGGKVPRELRAIIDRATRTEPDRRYPSVSELAADLRRYLHGEEVRAYPDNLARAAWRWIQSHPAAALSAVLVIVLVAASNSIWSLRRTIETKVQTAQHIERINELLGALTEHLGEIDRKLAWSETLVMALAVRVEEALVGEGVGEPRWFTPEDLRGEDAPPDSAHLARYDQIVSFATCVHVLAPGVERSELQPIAARMDRLQAALQGLFLQMLDRVVEDGEDPADWTPEETWEFLCADDAGQYAYVGFAQGLLVNYPAVDHFPEGYDPRLRPWYTRAVDSSLPSWGPPYLDASGSGLLLPCNVAIRDPRGALLGVAGFDVSVEHARRALDLELEGEQVREAYIVDSRGQILFSSEGGERDALDGLFDDREVELRPLRAPEVVEKIAEGKAIGWELEGKQLYIFSRLRTLDWTLVVKLDAQLELD